MTRRPGALTDQQPLNPRQKAFARELGVAWANGKRDFSEAYEAAGYKRDRGNAARLAKDPRVEAIANQVAAEAVKLAGVNLAYLQAKLLLVAQADPLSVVGQDEDGTLKAKTLDELTSTERAAISEMKIEDGKVTLKTTDTSQRLAAIRTLLQTIPNALTPTDAVVQVVEVNNATVVKQSGDVTQLTDAQLYAILAEQLDGHPIPVAHVGSVDGEDTQKPN